LAIDQRLPDAVALVGRELARNRLERLGAVLDGDLRVGDQVVVPGRVARRAARGGEDMHNTVQLEVLERQRHAPSAAGALQYHQHQCRVGGGARDHAAVCPELLDDRLLERLLGHQAAPTGSPTRSSPSSRMSPRTPPRCTSTLIVCGSPRYLCRSRQGSHSSVARQRSGPTRNSLPPRSFSRTPRVTTWRRERPSARSRPCSSSTASITSASISVIAQPVGIQRSGGLKLRSPSRPRPAWACTDSTAIGVSPLRGRMKISSTDPATVAGV